MERRIERKTAEGWVPVQFSDLKYKDYLRITGDNHLADGEYVTTTRIWPEPDIIKVMAAGIHRELHSWDYEGEKYKWIQ